MQRTIVTFFDVGVHTFVCFAQTANDELVIGSLPQLTIVNSPKSEYRNQQW